MTRTRRSPGEQARATSTTPIADLDSSLYRRQDGYAAPTADDRREASLLAELRDLGYQPATRCTRCNQWVVAPKSVALHMGPVCRAKSAAEAVAE